MKYLQDSIAKFIKIILIYGSKVCSFVNGDAIERMHMQFVKRMLGVNRSTQYDFIYGELESLNCQTSRYCNIIKLRVIRLKLVHTVIQTKRNKFNSKLPYIDE